MNIRREVFNKDCAYELPRCDKQRKEETDELEIVKDWEAGKIPQQ